MIASLGDAIWENLGGIFTALALFVTAVFGGLNLWWTHRSNQKREAAEASTAAMLAKVKEQTDGVLTKVAELAGKAGEKIGADAQKLSNVEKVQATDAQTEQIVAKVTVAVNGKKDDPK